MSRYLHVSAMKADGFAVRAACRAAEVSSSSYYAWCDAEAAGPTEAARVEAEILAEIRQIHSELDKSYGSHTDEADELRPARASRQLQAGGAAHASSRHRRVITERRRVRTTIPAEDAPPLPDLVV